MDLRDFYGDSFDKNYIEGRAAALEAEFAAGEGSLPERLFSSPGRAEILGNHTDHNHGKVLVAAISCDILAAVKRRDDGIIKICSVGYKPFEISLNDLAPKEREKGTSTALTRGVAAKLTEKYGELGGFTAYMTSDVFKGAGVSSSAAFEVLIAEIFNSLYLGGKMTAVEKAIVSQYAENVYFGKPCGLLDQSGIAIGSLSKLDFKDPKDPVIDKFPMISGYSLVITNTGGDHASLTAHYAAIRSEMESVAEYFGKKVLREVDYGDFFDSLPALRHKFSGRAILRALHFFEENERVDAAAKALDARDAKTFLKAVNESGLSSLDKLQNCAVPADESQPVILGIEISRRIIKDGAVRVHGGGFAGSVLAIVGDGEKEEYVKNMSSLFGKENVFVANVRKFGTRALD